MMVAHIVKCHDVADIDFVKGENCDLFDDQGRRYLDLESGCWCTCLGHSNPRIVKTMQTQVENIVHLGTRFPNAATEEAACLVLGITGIKDGKCSFLSSGSEAVELGAQIIKAVTGKKLLLTFSNSYLGSYGTTGKKTEGEWVVFDWTSLENPDDPACLDDIPFDKLGGFVFEPGGSGIGFLNFPPKKLVENIAARIKAAGGLIAANEITTGMGRTGKWFGFQHYEIQPDIVSIGKGLGNGYPVSCVAMKREIAETLEKMGFHYVQSHQNDPLGCTIARDVVKLLRDEKWIEIGAEKGQFFLAGLKNIAKKYPMVKDARGRGMLLGMEFERTEHFSVQLVAQEILNNQYLVGCYPAGNIIRFDPAFTIDKEDITRFLVNLNGIINKLSQ
jgi:acetylornithine/N-succinyldiaminopimelate aminotransferase